MQVLETVEAESLYSNHISVGLDRCAKQKVVQKRSRQTATKGKQKDRDGERRG